MNKSEWMVTSQSESPQVRPVFRCSLKLSVMPGHPLLGWQRQAHSSGHMPRWGLTALLTRPLVLQFEVLVREAASIDGLSPRAVVVGEVAGLRARSAG